MPGLILQPLRSEMLSLFSILYLRNEKAIQQRVSAR